MSLSNTCKSVIASVMAVAIIVPVSVLFIKNYNKNADARTTIVAMAPITSASSPQCVFAVPPTQDLDVAALSAYSMWEKVNGHFGRDMNPLIPIYADGHLGKKVAIQGYCDNAPGRTGYKFYWRTQDGLGDIYLKEIEYEQSVLERSPDVLQICGNQIIIYCLKFKNKKEESKIVYHPITGKFTMGELYGVSGLRELRTDQIDWNFYFVTVPYVSSHCP